MANRRNQVAQYWLNSPVRWKLIFGKATRAKNLSVWLQSEFKCNQMLTPLVIILHCSLAYTTKYGSAKH